MLSGLLFTIIVSVIAALHFYWALGGRAGLTAAIPSRDGQPLFNPSSLSTALVGLALLLAAITALDHIGALSLPVTDSLSYMGMWLLSGVFLMRAVGDFGYVGFFKRRKETLFAKLDTRFYSPLCLLLALLALGAILTS